VSAIVDVAAGLGMTVVAEGVEDGEQLRQVQRLGCHFAQGHHVARPLPADDAARWVTA
jgi:EAL domain-containing protein (putative c-di-GMP-specific phosphodiesterase class I)